MKNEDNKNVAIEGYIVETTQISMTVWATSMAKAVEQVLKEELCPLSAIVGVTTYDSGIRFGGDYGTDRLAA